MKTVTKQQMVEFLKLQEAKKWERMRENDKYFTSIHGPNFSHENISIDESRHVQRCVSEWMAISAVLSEFQIEAYSYSEREELKEQGKL